MDFGAHLTFRSPSKGIGGQRAEEDARSGISLALAAECLRSQFGSPMNVRNWSPKSVVQLVVQSPPYPPPSGIVFRRRPE